MTMTQAIPSGAQALLHEPPGGDPHKLTLVRALGSLVWDAAGNEYIDCTAQAWSNNLGANDPRVIAAVAKQLSEITHARPTYHTPALLELAELMVAIAPNGLDRVGFTLHGSMAVEMAFKLALRNRPDSRHILVLQDAYHGRSIATMAASWPHPNNVFGPIQGGFHRIARPDCYRPRPGLTPDQDAELCLGLLRDTITKGVDGPVAALIYEPIQGNGGHNEFPARWHQGLREVCDEFDILLIIDEVQTGFGRTGRMFATDYYDLHPDMLVFGKGVGGSPSGSSRSPSRPGWPPCRRSSPTTCPRSPPSTANTRHSDCAPCRNATRSSATSAAPDSWCASKSSATSTPKSPHARPPVRLSGGPRHAACSSARAATPDSAT